MCDSYLHFLASHTFVNVLFLTLASADLGPKPFAGIFICIFLEISYLILLDSAPTFVTGGNRSDCTCLQGQADINKECIQPVVVLLLKIVSLKDFEWD